MARNLFFIGAAVFYWGQMLDGAVNYKSYRDHLPGRATIYSILCPGLGQIYNREYWKLPIYYGGLAVAGYFWYYNDRCNDINKLFISKDNVFLAFYESMARWYGYNSFIYCCIASICCCRKADVFCGGAWAY